MNASDMWKAFLVMGFSMALALAFGVPSSVIIPVYVVAGVAVNIAVIIGTRKKKSKAGD